MEQQLQIRERQFYRDLKICATYYDLSRQCAIMAVMYMAYGLAYLVLNHGWLPAYCFNQAVIVGTAACIAASVPKILKEE